MTESVDSGAQTESEVSAAKAMLRDLFTVMGIAKIVVVDDQFSKVPELSDLLGAIRAKVAVAKESLAGISSLAGIDFDQPNEIWQKLLEPRWEALDREERVKVAEEIAGWPDSESDEHGRGVLGRLLDEYELLFLSLSEWRQQRNWLVATAATQPTLFLFDQDMTGNQGAADEGMKTIAALLKDANVGTGVYFGLFSNSVGANSEHTDHSEYARGNDIWEHRNRFAVISKQYLRSEPKQLALRLKRVAISPWCNALKMAMFGAIKDAVEEARQDLELLDVYDFEQIIFKSSYEEGVWEADTLFRLFGLFHREHTMTKAKNNPALCIAADKVRRLISFPYRPLDFEGSNLWKTANLENYERAEFLLAHRMPLEVGDIFQKVGGKAKTYLVLEQPCDLMVRGEDGNRQADEVLLLEIVEKPANAPKSELFSELPFLSPDPKKMSYAKLRQCASISACILDLSVFSADGVVAIDLSAATAPTGMIPAWQKRFEIVLQSARNKIAQYRGMTKSFNGKVPKDIDRIIQATLTGSVSGVVSGAIKLAPDRIEYNLKRVGRLKQPRSAGLLRDFAYYKARDAFDHDFTKVGTIEETGNIEQPV